MHSSRPHHKTIHCLYMPLIKIFKLQGVPHNNCLPHAICPTTLVKCMHHLLSQLTAVSPTNWEDEKNICRIDSCAEAL